MSFKDIADKESELWYRAGVKEGIILLERRKEFLQKVTVKMMQRKEWQERYRELFDI